MFLRGRSGSLLVFVVVGGLLIALLVVCISLVRQQTVQPAVVRQPQATRSESTNTPKKVESPAEVFDDKTTPKAATTSTSTVELPKTGAGEVLWASLTVGVLSFAAASYIQSRRLDVAF